MNPVCRLLLEQNRAGDPVGCQNSNDAYAARAGATSDAGETNLDAVRSEEHTSELQSLG